VSGVRQQCWIIRGIEVEPGPADADPDRLAAEHQAYIAQLDAEGLLLAHGAARDETGERCGTGLIVIRAATRAEAGAIARREPYIASGVRRLELTPWQVRIGRLR